MIAPIRVAIIANQDKPRAGKLAARAAGELELLGAEVHLVASRDEDASAFQPHLVVVFGGDGTVLGAVAGLGPEPPDILAFNVGHLGYLAENPPECMSEILRQALAGELRSSKRMMIEAHVNNETRRWTEYALNEFVLAYRHNRRQLPFSVRVDGEELMDIRGDGVIIATPTGSTAYCLSAGGPVASPELAAIILAPLCPHQLANRSLVLNAGETVGVTHHGDGEVEVIADGRFCIGLERGEEIRIGLSRRQVNFLSQPRGRYKLLREKLGWGWKADYQQERHAHDCTGQ